MGDRSRYLKTRGEILLATDQDLRAIVEQFAEDELSFFSVYANAHVRMSEMGQEKNLLSEFDDNQQRAQGGYVEPI